MHGSLSFYNLRSKTNLRQHVGFAVRIQRELAGSRCKAPENLFWCRRSFNRFIYSVFLRCFSFFLVFISEYLQTVVTFDIFFAAHMTLPYEILRLLFSSTRQSTDHTVSTRTEGFLDKNFQCCQSCCTKTHIPYFLKEILDSKEK